MPVCGFAAWQFAHTVDAVLAGAWQATQPAAAGPPGRVVVWIVATLVTWHGVAVLPRPVQLSAEMCAAGRTVWIALMSTLVPSPWHGATCAQLTEVTIGGLPAV